MSRLRVLFATLTFSLLVLPASGQVVESDPNPARTDQSVTITFYADRGTGGLEGHDGDVYAHTGISTDQNPEKEWKCVKNNWPTEEDFSGNREDTRLTEIDDNVYELTIDDIRAYYQDTSTSCSLGDDEKIQTMNFVFRDEGGDKEGKAQGGEDIFVDVNDVSGSDPFLAANLLNPTADPPLYPFMTATDTTVNVTITADTSNVDSFSELRLYVDGQQAESTSTDSLTYALDLKTPNRFQIRAEVEATADGKTLTDAVETSLIRTPDVVEESRPSGIEDGINYDPNDPSSVTLSLNAPDKEFVYAIGDFSNWEIDSRYFMKKDGDHWWVTLDLSTSQQYDFQYFVDGEIRTFDPLAHKVRGPQDEGISEDVYPGLQSYPGDQTENMVSVIRPGKQQSEFEFSEFQAPEREDLVIYELLLRDFVEESSFDVLADTLDYLDRLGVNAVELMPVANFGGNNSWGYNPNAHLALDKSYGPPEGFKRFVEEAHSRGIAVIMDVVYNHVTDQSPLVQLYGNSPENPFIVNSQEDRGFCDDFFRELNQKSPFIQKYIDRANEYWINEFNVDGFRFDLAKCVAADFNDPNYSDEIVSGWKDVSDHVWDNVNSDAYMILEFFGDPSTENELGAYRADQAGGMMTWHNMNRPYSQADMGFVSGDDFSSDLSDSYFGTRSGYDQPSFIAYMESHDEQWLMRRKKAFGKEAGSYSTQDLQTALNRQKLVGAFYFTVPGPRMMWQFGELGYGWGEEECLKESDACSASDPGRTSPKPIRWDYRDPAESPDRVKLYKAWSALINLRTQHPVFTSPETQVSMKVGDGDVGRRVVLEHETMDAVVFGNFGVEEQSLDPSFPSSGTWYDYFTGEAVEIGSDELGSSIPLDPGEFHVYTSEPVDTPETGLVPYSSVAPPPEPPTNVSAETGTDQISLSWTASTSSDRTGYNLYRGTTANFDTTGRRIARLGPNVTSYLDVPDSKGKAYYYRLVTLDADGEKSSLTDAAPGVLYPQTISYDLSRSFGEGSRPEDYRLVALPGQVDRPLAQTLSGPAGDSWQAYWDDGTESDFFVQFDESTTFDFQTGRGFWLISDSTWTVEGEVASVSLGQGNTTTIPLHSGWNIIANPFGRDVSWTEVQSANKETLQPLWSFDAVSGFRQASDFASAGTGEAFYFLNNQDLEELTIPYDAAGNARSVGKTSPHSVEALMSLEVGQEGRWQSTLQIGWHPRAEKGVDSYDWVAPPNRFSPLSLRARSSSATNSREERLARIVQPETNRGQSFPLTLQSASDDAVSLRVQDLGAIGDHQVHLVNEETGRSYDLRREPVVQFQPSSESNDLTLLVGIDSFVREKVNELTTTELELRPGGPNPFRVKTTLTYSLPKQGNVTLEVFDVLGRRVRVLIDDSKDSGTYHATWDGVNDAGNRVASGVYLGRLSFGGETLTQKLVVVK